MADAATGEDVATAGIDVPSRPLEVWNALIDRTEWWPELEFDAVAGAPVRETWTESGRTFEATGRVLAVDPPRLLSFEWTEPGWGCVLTVAVTVGPAPAGAAVVVTERGFVRLGAPAALRIEHEYGWQEHLERLRDACVADSRRDDGAQD